MPLIPNLPAAGSLSASDLLIKDTGSTTQKLLVSNAYASETAPGFVSTGAQTFAGPKGFNANTLTVNATSQYPAILFKSQTLPNADRLGTYRFNFGGATPTRATAYIEEASFASGEPTGYFEFYYFPNADSGLSANQTYNVLTSKTHQFAGNKLINLPASGSVTLTFAPWTQAIIITNGYSSNVQNVFIIQATASGFVRKTLGTSSQITVTTNGLDITFANAHTSVAYLDCIIVYGSIAAA